MARAADFGAKGDGIADDTAALQHALNEGDGPLYLDRGHYRLTRPLEMDLSRNGPAALLGAGGTARLLMAGPGPALIIAGGHEGTAQPASVRETTWRHERFPQVADLEIVGLHPEAVGIRLSKTMQAVVSRVLVRQCRYGIQLVQRNRNFILADSHLYHNREFGLFFDRCNLHQANIHGCHISYNQVAGIHALQGDVHNVQICGNDIEYNHRPAGAGAGDGPPAADIWFQADDGVISEVAISGNTIQATPTPGGANLRIAGGAEPPKGAWLIAVTGNVLGSQRRGVELLHVRRVTLCGNTLYDAHELSILARHCTGLVVSGNTFGWRAVDDETPREGIYLEDCDNVLLSGLSLARPCAGGEQSGGAITLVRCRDAAISDCHVLDAWHRAIELDNCLRCRVSNNTLSDRRDKPRIRHGVRVSGQCRQILVQGNLVAGAAAAIELPDFAGRAEGNSF